jgi:hypothetical protein
MSEEGPKKANLGGGFFTSRRYTSNFRSLNKQIPINDDIQVHITSLEPKRTKPKIKKIVSSPFD